MHSQDEQNRALECYGSEDLWLQRKFCNAFHFRHPALLTTQAEVSTAGFENLLAEKKGSCPKMMKMLVVNTGGFHKTGHEIQLLKDSVSAFACSVWDLSEI